MKNIYSILSLCFVLISVSVIGQSKIYAPTLNAPENMEVGQVPDVQLDWNAVTGVSTVILYELQLSDNIDFSGAITFEKTDLTAMSMSDLMFGGAYFWRVRAYDGDLVSDWSEAWGFSVLWNPVMDKPNDGDEVYANPTISWDAISGINGYELQLDTSYAWAREESGVSDDIFATAIVADDNIWAVGDGGLVLHYDGTEWTTMDVGTTEALLAISFADASNGYIAGDAGTVLFYDGSAWTATDAGTTANLTGVSFADSDNGVVVGEGGVVSVYNSGTWTVETTGSSADLFAVDMIGSSIWACGDGGVIVSYNGTEWTSVEAGNKDLFGLAMVDANNGWAVGKSGKIQRWDGSMWYEETSNTVKTLTSVSFSGMNGYAVGDDGTMVEFAGSWNPVSTGLEEDLTGVSITSDNGLVVGVDGVMLKKSNSGFNSPILTTYDIPADTGSWGITNLLFGQTYYYRIRAFHGSDTSQWSGVKQMYTQASPELDSPSDGSETDLYIKFTWDEYEGITNYIFEIDTDENFGMPRSFAPDDDTLWVNDLVFGEEYFWRVAAQHAEDISYWSEVWTLTTVNKITLESPENDAVEVIRCPLFTWIDVAGTSEYELWVDTDASFSNPAIHNGDDPSYQCQSTLDVNTMYYWKVRGKSGALVSEWSDTWSFTTEQGIGIDEDLVRENVSIFPNPGTGDFNLNIDSKVANTYDLRVIDISGKLVFETKIDCQAGNNSIPVSIDNIVSGSYNLVLSSDNAIVSTRLVIK